jgi:ABC-2 type transport system ATP-binding protein
VSELVAAASDGRVNLQTVARSQAAAVLASAGATVAVTGPNTLTIAGLTSDRVVALLAESATPFSEVSSHQATLEEAYMELTRNQVDYRPVSSDEEGS